MQKWNRNRGTNNWNNKGGYNNNRPKKQYDTPKPVGLQVYVREGEDINKALRKLKKKIERDGLMQEIRNRQYFVKPSEKKRKAKQAGKMRWLKKQRQLELDR